LRLLLDTHAFLWFVLGDARLNGAARQRIESTENVRLLSVASLWEISIKVSIGRLEITSPLAEFVTRHVKGNAIQLLSVDVSHLDLVSRLPFHHRDPFDRLIAVQSLVEKVPLLSRDSAFDDYGVSRLWDA
jgi:PIN domain nuclease of toxin-antitoxin system